MGFMKKVMAAAQGPPAAMNNRINSNQNQSQQQQQSSYPPATTTSMPTAYAAQVASPYIPPGGGGGGAATSPYVPVASEYVPYVPPAMAIPASAVHLTSHLPITAATPPTFGGGSTTNDNSLYSTFNNINLDAINSAPPYMPPGGSTATTASSSSSSSAATTMRVPIPEGMNPGQQIRVRGPDGSEVVKSIPPRNEWKYDAPKPYFRVQFGGGASTTSTTTAPYQKTKTSTTTTTTMRIPVPDGYGPDQQIRVRGPDGSEVVKSIPPRNEWQYDNGKPFFRLQFHNNADAASGGTTSYNPYANPNNGIPTTYDELISSTSAPTYDPWEQNTSAATTNNNNNNGLSPAAAYNPYANPANGVTPLQQNNNIIPPMATAIRVDHHSSGGGVMGGAPLSDYCIEWRRFQGAPVQFSPPPLGLKSVPSIPRGVSSAVSPNGRHKSLLIGINYEGTRAKLRGCVNDAKNMMTLLQRNGFPNDGSHMLLLSDERNRGREYQPTVENILKAIKWFMTDVHKGDVLFFHFSGHGGQVPDKSGHESDGWNETIVPVDFQKKGQITDDVLWGTLCYDLPDGARLTALMDMCHSGTGLDLPYDYNVRTKQWKEDTNPAHSAGDVCLFSGCEDAQTSADIGGGYGKEAGGAMTQAFLKAYESTAVMSTYHEFLEMVQRQLKSKGLSQRPQLTSSQMFDARSRIFSLGCNSPPGGGRNTNCIPSFIEPNHNPSIGREKRRHVKPGRQGFMGGGGGGGNNALQMVGGIMAGAFIADMLF